MSFDPSPTSPHKSPHVPPAIPRLRRRAVSLDLLAVVKRSMRLARLADTLPAINWLQTVGSLERQHPSWILRGKRADLIQLPKLVLGERDFDRREIVLKL